MKFVLMILILLYPWMGAAETEKTGGSERIENLLIWKLTDELDLSAKEEIKFSEFLKKINKEKRLVQTQIATLVSSFEKHPDGLQSYLKKNKELLLIQEREVLGLQAIIGKSRAAKYIFLRQNLLERLTAEVSKPANLDKGR